MSRCALATCTSVDEDPVPVQHANGTWDNYCHECAEQVRYHETHVASKACRHLLTWIAKDGSSEFADCDEATATFAAKEEAEAAAAALEAADPTTWAGTRWDILRVDWPPPVALSSRTRAPRPAPHLLRGSRALCSALHPARALASLKDRAVPEGRTIRGGILLLQ